MISSRLSFKDRIYKQLMGECVLTFPHASMAEKGFVMVPLFRGILFYPFGIARAISQNFTQNHISVGSGCGGIETLVFDGNGFIGVDPDPAMGCENYEIFHPPEFKTVNHLVEKKPEVVGDCSLWLMWPNNSCIFCEKGVCVPIMHHQAYDFDAIQALKPKTIVMLVSLKEKTSGSKELKDFVTNWKDTEYVLNFTCSSTDVSLYAMKLFPLIVEVQFFFFTRRDVSHPTFRSYFERMHIPPVFYTTEDYMRIRRSMAPKDLVFDSKEQEILDVACKKSMSEPFMSRIRELTKKTETGPKKRMPPCRSPSTKFPSKSTSLPAFSSPSLQPSSSSAPSRISSPKEDKGFFFVFE